MPRHMPVPLFSKLPPTEPRPATPLDSMAIPMRSRRLDLPHLRTPAITLMRSVSQKKHRLLEVSVATF